MTSPAAGCASHGRSDNSASIWSRLGPSAQVLGEKFTGGGTSRGQDKSGFLLPFTGSWTALTFWIDLIALLAGGVLMVIFRRRHDSGAPDS